MFIKMTAKSKLKSKLKSTARYSKNGATGQNTLYSFSPSALNDQAPSYYLNYMY